MKITLLQTDISWADPEKNIGRAEELMAECEGSDLYVLPEMWATGFATKPEGIAEEERTSRALAWMRHTAVRKRCAISGSLAVRLQDGAYRNRHYFVAPDKVSFYDKRHLFSHGHEDEHYTRGSHAVIAEWKGWRFLLQTCYDLRFPVWSRNRGDYDTVLYVANWPTPRVEAWKALLRARAIENQCYVAGVNRVGTDPSCEYCGGSAIISPYGQTLADCEDGKECVAEAEIDMQALEAFRQKFPVLNDADGFYVER